MARLPDVQDQPVDGAPVSTQAVAPSNFGLDQAGSELERAALAQVRQQGAADNLAAQPALVDAKAAMDDKLRKAAATYTGAPGLVDDQKNQALSSVIDARASLAKGGATPGVLSEFDKGANSLLLQHTMQASTIQSTVQAKKIADAFDNSQTQKVNGADLAAQASYGPAIQTLQQSFVTGGDPVALRDQGLAAFDSATSAASATLPPDLQPRYQQIALQQRQSLASHLADYGLTHNQAGQLKVLGDQLDAVVNGVATDPASYDQVVAPGGTLDRVLQTAPAGLRDDARHEWLGKAAEARVKSLIDNQQYSTATGELQSGRYDSVLEPQRREALQAQADAENRAHGPLAVDRAVAADQWKEQADADAYARATTGKGTGVDYDAAANGLVVPPEAVAEAKLKAAKADQLFAAAGSIRDWSPIQLQAAATSAPPDPSQPGYDDKLFKWQTQRDAAAAEIKARQDPGQWAYQSGKVAGKGAPGAAGGQATGAILQSKWSAFVTAAPGDAPRAGGDYAGYMIGTQNASGIAASQQEIITKGQAATLASSVTAAPPEGRQAALANIAGIMTGLPASFRLPDGTTASPRQMLVRQLIDAKLPMADLAAIVDSNGDPNRVAAYAAALNNPTLKGAAVGKQETQLNAAVRTALTPYIATATSPADQALNQGRLDYIGIEARQLMATTPGLSPQDAAIRAAAGLKDQFSYMNGWRMPASIAAQPAPGVNGGPGLLTVFTPVRGDQAANIGSHQVLASLTANGGAAIYAPSTIPGPPADRQRAFASQVMQSGQWKTLPDNSGLQLVLPKPDGTMMPVSDKWGRPVARSWQQLQAIAAGQPDQSATPPPNQPKAPDGRPVPAFSQSQGFASTVWAVTGQESRFKNGAVGPQTRYGNALGVMQVIPKFAEPYAEKLFGAPLDVHRLQWDEAYNTKIGSAMLSDNIQHYGATGPGLALAIAAYNAGRGNVDGYSDARGYHPGIIQAAGDPRTPGGPSLNDWIPRIVRAGEGFKQTRDYVANVLPAAFRHMQGGH